jgi:creatinine amidohydrolase/Fe(II)-dependent formamide hydrolase-like protein
MKQAKFLILILVCLFTITAIAQQRGTQAPAAGAAPAAGQAGQRGGDAAGGGRGGGRGAPAIPLTPEEEKLKAAALERLKLPLDTLDTVWIEEMTDPEVRAAITTGGKTVGIILTGGTESNGPHLASGKHNYVLSQTGEAIARRLGNALVAPIVTLEPGQVSRPLNNGVGGGWPSLSQETYRAVLTDMGDSMRGMGFKTVLYLGDSGSNTGGMQQAANTLNEKYKGEPTRFYHIPEYYDYRSAQEYIQHELGIPELMRLPVAPDGTKQTQSNGWADGIHEEYAIDVLMALRDPNTIRYYQRVKAGRAVINGVDLAPLYKTLENGRKILELRAKLTVAGIQKATALPPPHYGQPATRQQ